jgi:FkbM family methyltransferase
VSHPYTQRPDDLCIYGAGNTGRRTIEFLKSHGIQVRAVVDLRGTPERRCGGHPVVPLSEAGDVLKGASVVTAIFNRDFDFLPTRNELLRLGASRVLSFAQWFGRTPSPPGATYWLDREATIPDDVEERCLEHFADEKSVRIFRANLWARREFDDTPLPPPDHRDEEYVPSDIPAFGERRVFRNFVDAGAYDGDTLDLLVNRGGLETALSFEPDAKNFAALRARIGVLRARAPGTQFEAFPYGLWKEDALLSFNGEQGEGSALVGGCAQKVRCVALDEILPPGFEPTLVKMDIEGAEPEALRGARRTITRFRPHLALCVYHKPDHLWSLLMELASWSCRYAFYLRSFGFCGFDTVLFAVPQ